MDKKEPTRSLDLKMEADDPGLNCETPYWTLHAHSDGYSLQTDIVALVPTSQAHLMRRFKGEIRFSAVTAFGPISGRANEVGDGNEIYGEVQEIRLAVLPPRS